MTGEQKNMTVRAGFIPLLDASIPIVARERGFAAEEGIELELVRETSWANIRDRIAIGHFDVAHMLAPMPIAASLGNGPLECPLIAPMALGLGGNAVTVSTSLWQEMAAAGATLDGDASTNGAALKQVLAVRTQPPVFGVVHPYSSHNYELRYWLAASGIRPDRDVRFVVVPPPYTADALAAGRLDGFCVGEPWNSIAVDCGAGVIATTKSAIWRSSPEKVLGVRADWAAKNEATLAALLRAMVAAADWSGRAENAEALADILARPDYLGRPAHMLLPGLTARLTLAPQTPPQAVADFLMFADRAATFPWISHALWFYSQMVRWGDVAHNAGNAAAARSVYRPDIYRAALANAGIALPTASSKVEGALSDNQPVAATRGALTLGPDGFFDQRRFDPEALDQYIAADRTSG